MIDPVHARHPVLDDVMEATRRLEQAERARAQALRAWEVSDEPYPLNAAIALEAAERDLRLATARLQAVQKALRGDREGRPSELAWDGFVDDKSWGSH